MIQVYADDSLVYDSRLEEYDLVGLTVTNSLNVGGTAEIILPAGHPAYNSFFGLKTIVTIYRDGELRFRGRALYSADTFYGQRTITCEGELCLLRDGINRPYLYQASPRSCFVTLINAFNAQMVNSPFKHFKVGDVTVEDANDYVRLESESAETFLDTLNKLLERCGGYIVFTTDEDGNRVINWLTTLENRSEQVIEFGENLLDFSSTNANNSNFVTTIIPYGAKDETTKKRITIASVNGGVDYLTDNEAQRTYGNIVATVTWDDVTVPANLKKKAAAYLEANNSLITSLELTTLDLSYLDKDIDSFSVGDLIRVRSTPHRLDEDFQLTQLTEDLRHPEKSRITLGKEVESLTRADAAGAFKNQNELNAVQVQVNQTLDMSGYATKEALSNYVPLASLAGYATAGALAQEVTDRKALVDLVSGHTVLGNLEQETSIQGKAVNIGDADHVTHIRGGDRIKVHSRMHMVGSMLDFDNAQGIRIYNADGNVYYQLRVDESNNTFVGTDTNKLYLRGPTVYLKQSNAVVTSDERQKHSIEDLPAAYLDMLDKLTPKRFKYKEGTSDRYHVGFIAQDVERALTGAGLSTKDFGGFVDLDGDGKHLGLAYDEFIGLIFQKIRQLEGKIKALEDKQ